MTYSEQDQRTLTVLRMLVKSYIMQNQMVESLCRLNAVDPGSMSEDAVGDALEYAVDLAQRCGHPDNADRITAEEAALFVKLMTGAEHA